MRTYIMICASINAFLGSRAFASRQYARGCGYVLTAPAIWGRLRAYASAPMSPGPSSATDLSSKLALFRAFRYNIPRRCARQSRTAHPIQGGAMGLYIDRSNSGFKSALSGTIQYVDKSGLIAHLNANIDSEQRFLCITRPRRFGKTLAAQMIAAYYNRACNSRDLFANLDIARNPSYETHLNRYPVIFFDVQEQRSNVTRGDDFVAYLQEKIGFELKNYGQTKHKIATLFKKCWLKSMNIRKQSLSSY